MFMVSENMTEQHVLKRPVTSELLWGHPKGLYILFLTEMWERFSYYGMRALLIFYLTQYLLFSDSQSIAIYGAYTALIYIAPVIGGIISDRYLGSNKSVIWGGLLMILGHIGMAFEGVPAVEGVNEIGEQIILRNNLSLQVFFISITFLIVGVGFFKANISTMVGQLYPQDDFRRDTGFTIFFWGINIGAFLAAAICGFVGQKFGWGYGFGIAGIGMAVGLLIFIYGQKYLYGIGDPPSSSCLKAKSLVGLSIEHTIYLASFLAIGIIWQIVQQAQIVSYFVLIAVVISLAWTVFYACNRCEPRDRDRMLIALAFMTVWIIYAALFEQMGSSLNLFTDRFVNLNVFGLEFMASQVQGLPSLFLLIITPFFFRFWGFLDRHGLNPPSAIKFALSLIIMGLGYYVLSSAIDSNDGAGRINLGWIILLYLFFAVSDLFIGPIGLSLVTKLSVTRALGFMMGLWMLSVAIGSYLASRAAQYVAVDDSGDMLYSRGEQLERFGDFFAYLSYGSLALGVFFLLLYPLIRKMMHGIN
jgi:POT family proton-dependent oligopeptide transporter